ncbi:hypothetical protein V6N11_002120 [Hibiscus sabdariffa]|uniref:Reverse transcriptase zinc-binding domain-containing protein n=1 Tax=Hibiscus sabdariffa TaxID=183260 RepID=A0ABR2QUB1_9ROSI
MDHEAEEFTEEDKKVNEKIDARNSLETYIYNMKNHISDKDKLKKGHLSSETTRPLPGRALIQPCRSFAWVSPRLWVVTVSQTTSFGKGTIQVRIQLYMVISTYAAPFSYLRPSPLWKAIKQLPTLPKVCILAWRLGQDWLPVGGRIRAANLGPVETVELLSHSNFAKLLLLLWNMWNRRNRLVHDSHLQPVWATVTATTLLHKDFLAANDLMRRPMSGLVFSSGVWSPPPLGTMVISVDGGLPYSTVVLVLG